MAKPQRNQRNPHPYQQISTHEDDADDFVQATVKNRANDSRMSSKKRRDTENSVLQELFGLIPMHEDLLSKQDKLSLLRLVIAYFRLKDVYKCDPDRDAVASALHLMPDIELGSLTSLSREDVTDAEDASQEIETPSTQFPEPFSFNQDTQSFIDLSQPVHDSANHSNTNYQFQESQVCFNSTRTANGHALKREGKLSSSGKEQNGGVRLNESPNTNNSKISPFPLDTGNSKCEDNILSNHLEDYLYKETEADLFHHLIMRNGLRCQGEKPLNGRSNGVMPNTVPARTSVTKKSPMELVLSEKEKSFSLSLSTASSPSMRNKEIDSWMTSGTGVLALVSGENEPSEKSMVKRKNKKLPRLPDEGLMMLEAVSGFLLFLQADRTILFVSDNVSDHLGYNQAQMIGHSVDDLIHPSDLKELTRYMKQMLLSYKGSNGGHHAGLTRQTFYLGMRYDLSKEGQRKARQRGYTMVQWNVKLGIAHEENGEPRIQHLVSVCCPVRTNSILEIRAEGAMFMSRHDLAFHFIYCDASIIKLMGYEPSDLIGQTAYHFHCPKDVGLCKSCHVKLMKDGASSSGYYRFLSRNGAWVWLITHATIIEDTKKKPQYIVCRNYVVSEREAEEAIIKEKREYEEMKCLGFNLDTNLPITWNIQHAVNNFTKSHAVPTCPSNFSSGFEKICQSHQSDKNVSPSFVESHFSPSRSKSEELLLSKDPGGSHKHKQINFQKSSHQLIASSFTGSDSTQKSRKTQICVQSMANGAQKELIDPGIIKDDSLVEHGQSISSLDIVSVPDCLNSTQKKNPHDFFRDVNSEQIISSTTTPRASFSYVTTSLSLISSRTASSQKPLQEQSAPQMVNSFFENFRDHLICADSGQRSLSSAMLPVSDSMSYGPVKSKLNPNTKHVHGDRMSHDTKMHLSDNPMEFADSSLNPVKENNQIQTMIPLLSDDTSLSGSTLADADLDNRSNFYTNSFSVDIFPELDLNSEFTFHASGDLSCEENQENLLTDKSIKPNDVFWASRTNETLLHFSSECAEDLEQEEQMENGPHLLSSSFDNHQCMDDFGNSDLMQPLQPVSQTYDYNPAESIQVDINENYNTIPSVDATDSLISSSSEESMEVECNIFAPEDLTGVKDDSSVHIPKMSIVNNISVASPKVVQVAPENDLSSKTLDSLKQQQQNGHRSLLRSLLRQDCTDIDEYSTPSKTSTYEKSQGSESKHEELHSAETLTNMTDPLFHFSPSDNSSLNSPGSQKMTQELPLPKSALNSRHFSSPSPSQSIIYGGGKSPTDVERCSSFQSGDHIPEDLVDLAMEYCTFMDNHRAQEIISELSSLEWAEKQKNQPVSTPEKGAKPTSRPLPIPGISSKIQKEKQNLIPHQLPCNTKRVNRTTVSTYKNKHSQMTHIGKISRNNETKCHSSTPNFKMSLLRQAVTSPNVDKLIEQLPLRKTTLGIKNARTEQIQSQDKVNSCQYSVKMNVQSPKGSVQNSYPGCSNQKSIQKSSPTIQNHEHIPSTHSIFKTTVTSSTPSPSSLSPKSPKDTALAASPSSSHVHAGLSLSSRNPTALQRNPLTMSSSNKNSMTSKNSPSVSSTEPVSVMVMRKEHHRSRRSKNVSTQTDKRSDEIYPDPEPSSTDRIITPSVYVTQHPSSSSHNSPSSSVSLSEFDSSIWSMLVKSPSKASSLEIETPSGSLSCSLSPVNISDSDSQPRSRRPSLEPPSSVPPQKQGKPVSNLSFLHGLLTGELSKDNYQLLDQQLLERERSRSGSSCSDTD